MIKKLNCKPKNRTKLVLVLLALFIVMAGGVLATQAWNDPSFFGASIVNGVPVGNVSNPVNTGSGLQTKTGPLSIMGNVGIGTVTPQSKFTVQSAGAGYNAGLFLGGSTAASILPYNGVAYLSVGTYYEGGVWKSYHSSGGGESIFGINETNGISWYSGTGDSYNNVVNGVQLWDASGIWKSMVRSTQSGDSYFTGGNVGIGTASPGTILDVVSNNQMRIRRSTDTNGLEFQDFGTYKSVQSYESTPLALNPLGNNVGIGTTAPGYKLTVNGQPAANGYTAFTNYSDQRLKENIKPLDSVLSKIMQLKVKTFNYNEKTGYDEATRQRLLTGFIAQDLKEVFPEMVGTTKINNEEYYDTDTTNLQMYLVKAMQEQQKEIDELKKEVEALKNK